MTAVRLVIHGRVHGVGYRAWLAAEAAAAGLRGWVRNRRDGTVEAVLAGEAAAVRRVIDRCQAGPPLARVTRVETADATAPDEAGFDVRPTV